MICGIKGKKLVSTFFNGALGLLLGVILVLLASSIKFIITEGGIMDTILHYFSLKISGLSSFMALLVIYLLVLILNFFIGSGSAKAFLVIAIITPLLEMVLVMYFIQPMLFY